MASESDRRKAGRILTQWHESASDPIYVVGAFYVDGKPYPSPEVVERAIANLEACERHTSSARDKRDIQFAVGVMQSEIEVNTEEWKGGLDSETLDNLVHQEAESGEMEDLSSASATEELIEEADWYDGTLREALVKAVDEIPTKDGSSAQDVYELGDAPYLVLMTLQGQGVGIWDGDWDRFWDSEDLELVEQLLKKQLSGYADDAGGGSLNEAIRDAAFETAGGESPEPDSVREELMQLLERVEAEYPEAYQQLQMPGAGFPAVPSYAMEDDDSDWWESERAHQLRDELVELLEHGYVENRSRGDADPAAADELKLMIDNDQRYAIGSPRGMGKAIRENLLKKINRGRYDSGKAVKAWRNLADAAAKQIAQEQGQRPWHRYYSVPTRDLVAAELHEEFESEWMGG